jgi:hypothetical protein
VSSSLTQSDEQAYNYLTCDLRAYPVRKSS